MVEGDYIWEPYSSVMDTLPDYCTAGEAIWCTRSPLICLDVVEWYFPDRVLRQFGMLQMVPQPCDSEPALHHRTTRGITARDWSAFYHHYIHHWDHRAAFVHVGDRFDGIMADDDPYREWYDRITRIVVINLYCYYHN